MCLSMQARNLLDWGIGLMDFKPSFDNGKVVPTIPLESDNNRCQSLRLERSDPISYSSGNMVTKGSQAPQQPLGAQNNWNGSAPLDPFLHSAVGQCHSCGLFKSPRVHPESCSLEGSKPNHFVDRETLSSDLCCPHLRCWQLESGLLQ